MSYRETRNFVEMMKSLGYPRLISMENFRNPNFELVADLLFWLTKRYDPDIRVSDIIDSEDDRVEFLTDIAHIFQTRARIKLNTKRLYAADGLAVKEMLKIAKLLFQAQQSSGASRKEELRALEETTFTPVKPQDVQQVRVLANEITQRGIKLFDLLGREGALTQHRARAMRFLEHLSSTGSTHGSKEQEVLDMKVRELIESTKQSVEGTRKQIEELEADKRMLESKIEKKRADVDRSENRLRNLEAVRPAYMDEYERLEDELRYHYEIYVEKMRNLDFLKEQLDIVNKEARERKEESDRKLKRMQNRLRQEELRLLRGESKAKHQATSSSQPKPSSDFERPSSRNQPSFERSKEYNGRNPSKESYRQQQEKERRRRREEEEEEEGDELSDSSDSTGASDSTDSDDVDDGSSFGEEDSDLSEGSF